MPGGVDNVGSMACTLIETGNRLIFTDCSNAFSTAHKNGYGTYLRRSPPARRHSRRLCAKCYGERPASVIFRMHSGESRTIACSRGVHQGDHKGGAMGAAVFCSSL